MTEPRFEELINLYLDNEIGRHELGELKHAIRENVLRRQKFERACQIHQAARKALAGREQGTAAPNGHHGNGSSMDRPMAASAGPVSAASPRHTSVLGSLQHRQGRALRNASVPVLAERQTQRGAAASVNLADMNLPSSFQSSQARAAKSFSFFGSPIGLMFATVFGMVGAAGLYLLINASTPQDNNSGGDVPSGNAIVSQPIGSVEQKELLRELDSKASPAASPAEVMHETIYQSAAGQPATSSVQVNYSSTQAESVSPAVPMPNTSLPDETPANLSATVTLQISRTSLPVTTVGAPVTMNTSQLQITLPAMAGMAGNQDIWVRMSLPPVFAPSAGSADNGGKLKSDKDAPPKVKLP